MSVSPTPPGYSGGGGHWHGWGGSGRTYQLNVGGLPAHQYLCYDCLIHHVDSWDNEYQHINIDGNGVTERYLGGFGAPTGTANAYDVYTFTLVKDGNGNWNVYVSYNYYT